MEEVFRNNVTLSGAHERLGSAVSIDKSGSRMITGGFDSFCNFWDFNAFESNPVLNKPFKRIEPYESQQVNDIQFNNSGSHAVICTSSSQLKLVDREGNTLATSSKGDPYLRDSRQTKGHTAAITCCKWHPTNKSRFLTGSFDSTCRIWNLDSSSSKQQTQNSNSINLDKQENVISIALGQSKQANATCCEWSEPNKIFVGSDDGIIRAWDDRASFVRPSLTVKNAHCFGSEINSLTFFDDFYCCSRGNDDVLKKWDKRNGYKEPLNILSNIPTFYAQSNCIKIPETNFLMVGVAYRPPKIGEVLIIDSKTMEITHREHLPQSPSNSSAGSNNNPVRLLFHSSLYQLFVTNSNGSLNAFYDPKRSEKGVLIGLGKEARKAKIENISFGSGLGEIIVPALDAQEKRQKRKLDLINKGRGGTDTKQPEAPRTASIKGSQGTIGTNVVQHLMKEFVKTKVNNSRMEDPREALLKYAEISSKEKKYVTGYELTQPKEIFREEEEEPETESLTKKKKPFPFY